MESIDINIPKGVFRTDDDPLKKKREELKKKLAKGDKVTISQDGQVNTNDNSGNNIQVPPGKLATDDDPLKKKREELKKKLAKGDKVTISQDGQVNTNDNSGNNIQVPPGKLATFYWYDRDRQLYNDEVAAMRLFFPNFQLDKLSDGRLFWHGSIKPRVLGNSVWHLQLVYDNNHPDNSTYGGSVKVYVIEPDIDKMNIKLRGTIPHLLRDSRNNTYLCTARKEDVDVGDVVTSAAGSLAWAVKWISVFELWLAGEVTTDEFAGHTF